MYDTKIKIIEDSNDQKKILVVVMKGLIERNQRCKTIRKRY